MDWGSSTPCKTRGDLFVPRPPSCSCVFSGVSVAVIFLPSGQKFLAFSLVYQ